jgi:hypothetical protein
MATPATYNLNIYQGDTFAFTFRLRSTNPDGSLGAYVNLTGCTAKSQIRDGSGTLIVELTAEILDQSTTLGGVTLSLTHDQTAALEVESGLLWDVQITTAGGVVTTYLKGTVTVTAEVTQS